MDEKALRTEVQKLIEKYERVKAQDKYKSYNEENTKKDFILPLFRALGWNVDDSEEVKAEEKVSKKRVDYAFRINGVVKFYLEAKPLREYISVPKYAKQAIEYAWNKSVTWAILCNFEGIRVFNAEWKWDEKSPTRNSFLDLKCADFLNSSFQYLTWLSKESFEQGILDKNAATLGKKTKKLPIDKQLLADFTDYRNILTKDILKYNQLTNLSQDNLDEMVQRILDRLIFIRTCEDKEIESEKLESLVRMYGDYEGKLYIELNKKFREYDNGYNSKLFRKHLCEDVIISNDTLKQVILGTYQTKDLSVTYDFSAIGADVLGNIYEQYLGHILKKTSQRAKLTNGKAHRKEQGIYYTPTYIVDYIVRNTVGERLKQRKVKVDELKILDPACGSGSFLLKAFDVICEHEIKKEGKTLQTKFEDVSSGKILKRKTELLKNCIFGVDLDPQAVEITQLNLLLKLAEKRYRLPMLQENIKCGNSLIDDHIIAGNKAFKWEEEFNNIINNGGFDVVIGNPPYIFTREKISDTEKEFYIKNYETTKYQLNTYVLFIEKAVKLLKQEGKLGFIIPDAWLRVESVSNLRKYLLENTYLEKIIHIRGKTFEGVGVEASIIIIKKSKAKGQTKICRDLSKLDYFEVSQREWLNNTNFEIDLFTNIKLKRIIDKIEKESKCLDDLTNIKAGLQAYENGKGNPKQTQLDVKNRPYDYKFKFDKDTFKYLDGKNVCRYSSYWDGAWLRYGEWLAAPRTFNLFNSPRLLIREIPSKPPYSVISTYLENVFLNNRSIINILEKDTNVNLKFVLGILNSKLITFYHLNKSVKAQRDLFPKITLNDLRKFPIKIGFLDSQKEIIALVDKMLSLNSRLYEIGDKKTDERARIEDEIKKTDTEIDELVYKLYGLIKEEIAIVEESLK